MRLSIYLFQKDLYLIKGLTQVVILERIDERIDLSILKIGT